MLGYFSESVLNHCPVPVITWGSNKTSSKEAFSGELRLRAFKDIYLHSSNVWLFVVSTNLCKRHWSPLSVWLEEALTHSMFMIKNTKKKKKKIHALNTSWETRLFLGKGKFYFLKRCFLFLIFFLYRFGSHLRIIPVWGPGKWPLVCDLNQFTWLLWTSSFMSLK